MGAPRVDSTRPGVLFLAIPPSPRQAPWPTCAVLLAFLPLVPLGAAAFFLLVVVATRRRVAPIVARFKRAVDVRAGVDARNREDPETDASLSERLLGDASDGNGIARGATETPRETLREAKKKYRGPSDDADDAAHELVHAFPETRDRVSGSAP